MFADFMCKMETNKTRCKVPIVARLLVAIALLLILLVIVIPLAIVFGRTADKFRLHVNPHDPVIMSVETTDGEMIYMLGNKTSDGLPQAITEFRVENSGETTYVSMNTNGLVSSAINTDGLQLDFIWDKSLPMVHASLVLGDGSEQITINIDLSGPIDDNITDFENENVFSKRSVNQERSGKDRKVHQVKSKAKRQTDDQDFASVAVSVESCNMPELHARVFADVQLDYAEPIDGSRGFVRYTGVKTQVPGQYQVNIPIAAAQNIAEKICKKLEDLLGKFCDVYTTMNDMAKLASRHGADTVICYGVAVGVRRAFGVNTKPVYRFCKKVFRGVKKYCDIADKDAGEGNSLANLFCDSLDLSLVDNRIELLRQKTVFFIPSAVFPRGNTVTAPGQVIHLVPGSSTVGKPFIIKNDQNSVRITDFSVSPVDPAPGQRYTVAVTYECFSTDVVVTMDITGTDGYDGQNVCTTGPFCFLFVPGAEALVQDSVTVSIQDTSAAIVRKVMIIF